MKDCYEKLENIRNKTGKLRKWERFVRHANPSNDGVSREVFLNEPEMENLMLTFGNGGDWCRDSSSINKWFVLEKRYDGGTIVSLKLSGFNYSSPITIDNSFPEHVKNHHKGRTCVITGTHHRCEYDHTVGAKLYQDAHDPFLKTIESCQMLHKSLNCIKRNHCAICQQFKRRYEYPGPIPFIHGNIVLEVKEGEKFIVSENNPCKGCYWFNPPAHINGQIALAVSYTNAGFGEQLESGYIAKFCNAENLDISNVEEVRRRLEIMSIYPILRVK